MRWVKCVQNLDAFYVVDAWTHYLERPIFGCDVGAMFHDTVLTDGSHHKIGTSDVLDINNVNN